MSGMSFNRSGYKSHVNMLKDVVIDMVESGKFQSVSIQQLDNDQIIHPKLLEDDAPFSCLLEVLPEGNAMLAGNQYSWRVMFKVSWNEARLYVAPKLQLPDTAMLTEVQGQFERLVGWDHVGVIGSDIGNSGIPFVDRTYLRKAAPAYPMGYILTLTERGFVFFSYEETFDDATQINSNNASWFSWLCVQRPVDPESGEPLVSEMSPVFAAYEIKNGFGHVRNKFVVREADVYVPTKSQPAWRFKHMDNAILPHQDAEVNYFTDDNTAKVFFPHNLNTRRYRYKHVLDLIAYSEARLFGSLQNVEFSQVFYEKQSRRFKTVLNHAQDSTGTIILIYINGPEIKEHVRSVHDESYNWLLATG
ncbi:hypothetical protein HUZ36_14105 [Pseudoalteromonas sp. McH1-7]|uniref:Uncharacterized protein n=1 Tax=Pseudoalteromonas peptidolytica F12-50-A1 TaxID=1315280 RepID=A0A8I0T625_9GAMM|nr:MULTISPECIES: hypothetical protein [Pseudoalteromonas]MBE0347868.1 hypothetical protein [Pseudoalteromonas peptidolytica F12-50-A1]MDW7551302.1 hypothetical protein [Pseudoalteromonas peptidolytica]NLR15332.1 hypothetical protein [Pseudoalteromonas peptidolytica]NUZ11917.1 hypothetical protein [Pseudoalteromonas sp. McH1-7]RRS09107.1 hypothetical protein EAG18_08280 [Pseudoalteromonas sp. J010]